MNSLLNLDVYFASAVARLLGSHETVEGALVIPPRTASLQMRHQAILAVDCPLGQQVRCIAGVLWVTHDGDPRDIVVTVGETYRADRCARMLVAALEDSELEITRATGPSKTKRSPSAAAQ